MKTNMWPNNYSPYARRERYPQPADEENEVDVSEIARAQGFHYPVALSAELARALKPNQLLSTFGIRFERRVRNVLAVLKTQMNPKRSRYYDDEEEEGEDCSFPFVVLQGPNIEERLISIRARVTQDEEGGPLVRLDSSYREAA
jgi:hypothetical protein